MCAPYSLRVPQCSRSSTPVMFFAWFRRTPPLYPFLHLFVVLVSPTPPRLLVPYSCLLSCQRLPTANHSQFLAIIATPLGACGAQSPSLLTASRGTWPRSACGTRSHRRLRANRIDRLCTVGGGKESYVTDWTCREAPSLGIDAFSGLVVQRARSR